MKPRDIQPKKCNMHFIEAKYCKEKKNYAGSEKKHPPHKLRKRSHFGTRYRKTPPPIEKKKDQWGSGGLQA
jgi:hypothetical protein